MFHVATFGTNGFFKTLVSNYNQSSHATREAAESRMHRDMIALLADGWHYISLDKNNLDCAVCDEMHKFYRLDDVRYIGWWEF